MITSSARVTLREITKDDVESVIGLSVSEAQDDFVAPNAVSMSQAFVTTKVWVRAVYADEAPVGFAMLSDDDEQPRYYLWRFMIDQRYQGMGFGKQAMELVHEYVRTRPGGTRIFLSYVPAEGGPEHFYKSVGYVDTGKVHDGEVEAVLELSP